MTEQLPAVVTIPDLPTATTLLPTALFEAAQTTNGVGESVQVPLTQLMTTGFGALPIAGNTGQFLTKTSATNFATGWSDLSSFISGTGTIGVAGSTTLVVSLASNAGLSVLGVAGPATATPAAIIGTAGQVLRVNDAGTAVGFGFINITASVTGILDIPHGGTGTGALTPFAVLAGGATATSQVQSLATTASSGFVLTSNGSAALPTFQRLPIQVLTANLDLFVATTGTTANTGLTVGSPKRWPQEALNLIASSYDLGGPNRVFVNCAAGTYSTTGRVVLLNEPWRGGNPLGTTFPSAEVCPVVIRGSTTSPASVIFNSTLNDTVLVDSYATVAIEGVTITSDAAHGMHTGTAGQILVGRCILGTTAGAKVFSGHAGPIEFYDEFSIIGNSTYIFDGEFGGSIFLASVTTNQLSNITVTAFARALDGAEVTLSGYPAAYSTGGFTMTGKKFEIVIPGSIRTNTTNLNVLPGSLPGTITLGGYGSNSYLTSGYTINTNASTAVIAPPTGTIVHTIGTDGGGGYYTIDGIGTISGGIIGRRAGGTLASPAAATTGSLNLFVGGLPATSATTFATGNSASIQFINSENVSSTRLGAEIDFLTTTIGTTTTTTRWIMGSEGALYARGVTGGDVGTSAINLSNIYRDGVRISTTAFSANKNGSNQAGIATSAFTTVTFGTTEFNVGSAYSTGNSAWVPPVGTMRMNAAVYLDAGVASGEVYIVSIFKDGVRYKDGFFLSSTTSVGVSVNCIDRANGTSSYDVRLFSTGASTKTINGTNSNSYFMGAMEQN